MPIYEYKCQQCGAHIEVRQSVSDAPLTTCEKCHGPLEKQWSLSGFQFKGAGWYVTDYSKKGGETKAAGEKTTAGESTAAADAASNTASGTEKPSGGTDTKTAA
ncbi:MAG: zinc ribbon domain-containing protein [Acidobacteria bacterium]|nr:zinc ribbon domain-containing protein [Acidobacteriota bacterium]